MTSKIFSDSPHSPSQPCDPSVVPLTPPCLDCCGGLLTGHPICTPSASVCPPHHRSEPVTSLLRTLQYLPTASVLENKTSAISALPLSPETLSAPAEAKSKEHGAVSAPSHSRPLCPCRVVPSAWDSLLPPFTAPPAS